MNTHFETFAKKICEYCMNNFVLPWMREHGVLMTYRAQVVSKNGVDKTMVVQRPFDNNVTVPYSNSADDLTAGDQCVVFSLGESLNSVVFADGKLNISQSGGGGGGSPEPSDSNPLMDGMASPGTGSKYSRADHVHPTDTSRAAASAIPTKTSELQNDSGFLTSVPTQIWYGTSSTAATTQNKVVTTQTGDFTLTTGATVNVTFTNAQTYNGIATLNVDGTGAKDVYRSATDSTSRYYWGAGSTTTFIYDGSKFLMADKGYATTTYYGITKLSASVTSTSTSLAASASAVKTVNDKIELRVPEGPSVEGTYVLQCSVDSGGNATYAWVAASVVTQDANGLLNFS